jgi:glycine hydroxymethyltransferase
MPVTPQLAPCPWLPPVSLSLIQSLAAEVAATSLEAIADRLDEAIADNRAIHERDCVNLNPAANVMNPKAEAALAAGLGCRPSLGHPGDKYEMGLEAIERIEVATAELAAEVFGARYVEFRVPTGALANLYALMATAKPGDAIISPPASIGGHVTHQAPGCAGLYGLDIFPAPVDADGYTVDVAGVRALARDVHPKLITIGASLNLFPHPVAALREVADEIGARLLFDAAHLSGMIAGGAWPNPLAQGAHLMTMSTYKSLAGPPSGLVLTNDPLLAEALDRIAFPGMTANYDAGKAAALAITLLDWKACGPAYAREMALCARALAEALAARSLPVFASEHGATASHQFALRAAAFGGGQAAARRLRRANLLASGIGLPEAEMSGDLNGLRLGTCEIVRWGMTVDDMEELAGFIARTLTGNETPEAVAKDVTAFRRRFDRVHFVR